MRIAFPPLIQLVLGALLLTVASTSWSQSFSTLEERMSAAQFQAAGLDKLSPEELASLNAWLQSHVAGAAGSAMVAPMPQSSFLGGDDSTVASRIVGPFKGWEGKTKFELENGQIWQQVGSEVWRGVNLDNPSITIRPGAFGSSVLRVEGYNSTVRVKRIR